MKRARRLAEVRRFPPAVLGVIVGDAVLIGVEPSPAAWEGLTLSSSS